MDEQYARVEIEGLPALSVTGVIAPAEPEVGIWSDYLDELSWEAAEGELTGEQEALALSLTREIGRRFMAAIEQRARDAYEEEISAVIEQRANGAW